MLSWEIFFQILTKLFLQQPRKIFQSQVSPSSDDITQMVCKQLNFDVQVTSFVFNTNIFQFSTCCINILVWDFGFDITYNCMASSHTIQIISPHSRYQIFFSTIQTWNIFSTTLCRLEFCRHLRISVSSRKFVNDTNL